MIEFTAKDICAIMREAHRLGVARLEMGNLKVEFGDSLGQAIPAPPRRQARRADMQQIEKNEAQAIAEVEQKVREDEMANLILEDPLAYERLVANGELDDVESEP